MYSPKGEGLLVVIAKLGPWTSRDTWASMRGAFHRFFTHFSECTVVVVIFVVSTVVAVLTADAGDVSGEDTASDVKPVLCAIHV